MICLIIFSSFDKKYVKFNLQQLVVELAQYVDFVYQKKELDFEYVSMKII